MKILVAGIISLIALIFIGGIILTVTNRDGVPWFITGASLAVVFAWIAYYK